MKPKVAVAAAAAATVEVAEGSPNIAALKEKLASLREECKRFEGINVLNNLSLLMDVNISKVQTQVAKIFLMLKPLHPVHFDL